MAVATAFLARGFAEAREERLAAVLRIVGLMAALFTTHFFAGYVGQLGDGLQAYGGYFGFAIVGLVAFDLFSTITGAYGRRVREAQLTGALDALLATPTPETWIVTFLPLWDILASLGRGVATLLVAALLFGAQMNVNALATFVAVLFVLAAFLPLGLLGAAWTMRLRRGDPLTFFLAMVSSVFGAVMYPLDALPPWAQRIGEVLPLTQGLAALREVLLRDAPLTAIVRPLATLAVMAAVFFAVGLLAFRRALRRARIDGSLTTF